MSSTGSIILGLSFAALHSCLCKIFFAKFLRQKMNISFYIVVLFLDFLIGIIATQIKGGFSEDDFLRGELHLSKINPHLIYYIFLPLIIFDSSSNASFHIVQQQIVTTILVAGPDVFISKGITTLFVVYLFPHDFEWSWVTSLLLGSILSTTYPESIVTLLQDCGASHSLSSLIESEALLNDGLVFVLFSIFNRIIVGRSFAIGQAISDIIRFSLKKLLEELDDEHDTDSIYQLNLDTLWTGPCILEPFIEPLHNTDLAAGCYRTKMRNEIIKRILAAMPVDYEKQWYLGMIRRRTLKILIETVEEAKANLSLKQHGHLLVRRFCMPLWLQCLVKFDKLNCVNRLTEKLLFDHLILTIELALEAYLIICGIVKCSEDILTCYRSDHVIGIDLLFDRGSSRLNRTYRAEAGIVEAFSIDETILQMFSSNAKMNEQECLQIVRSFTNSFRLSNPAEVHQHTNMTCPSYSIYTTENIPQYHSLIEVARSAPFMSDIRLIPMDLIDLHNGNN
ncbi:unnamed protein product [Rotaria magnacalcarata]